MESFYKIPIIIPHIIVVLFAITFLSDTGVLQGYYIFWGYKMHKEMFFKNLI